jgi:hypothetical protein
MAILIGIPTYDHTLLAGLHQALSTEGQQPGCPPYKIAIKASSLLAFAHNALLCTALNNRPDISHLLINHADVVPEPGYLRLMYEEMLRKDAGVVSAVIPIKDNKGLTSTALLPDGDTEWMQQPRSYKRRRMTMREVMTLPATFEARDVAQLFGADPDRAALLVNTGLMLIDVQQPWSERVYFQINDTVCQDERGKFVADVEPEDWFFSRQLARLGVKAVATRKVKVTHYGRAPFANDSAWGEWEHDRDGGAT